MLRIPERALGLLLISAGVLWLIFDGLRTGWHFTNFSKNASERTPLTHTQGTSPQSHTDRQNFSDASSPKISAARVRCRVLKVYDGDTLGCDLNQNGRVDQPDEDIRLLGIDSPEMHYSRKNPTFGTLHPQDEPFAAESSRWLTEQVDGKTVFLEFDIREYDRYGRHLAYVFTTPSTNRSLNEESLTGGYAKTLFLGKNRHCQERFEASETKARQNNRGLWRLISQ